MEHLLPRITAAVERHFASQLPDTRVVLCDADQLAQTSLDAAVVHAPEADTSARRTYVKHARRDAKAKDRRGSTLLTPSRVCVALLADRNQIDDLNIVLAHARTCHAIRQAARGTERLNGCRPQQPRR